MDPEPHLEQDGRQPVTVDPRHRQESNGEITIDPDHPDGAVEDARDGDASVGTGGGSGPSQPSPGRQVDRP